jgi:carboxyl-terminal processing protease
MVNKKFRLWLPLIFSVVMIVGMIFGYKLKDQAGGNNKFFSSNKGGSLQEALDLIRLKYVENVQIDSLEMDAIQEMMNRLDPHSVYFPPVELKEANEDLAGNFEGIGVEFNVFRDTVNIVYVIPEGPSDRSGLKVGDKIIRVNDSVIAGKSLTTDQIRDIIRGEKGTQVALQVLRGNQLMKITVTRGRIPVSSVEAAYIIQPATGYIRLTKFTENSYEEFMRALEDLQKADIRKLILDLRGNGGGFMNEAVEMADEFLDGDKTIVYTEGAHSKKRIYKARRPGLFEKGKLVILQDELSASASEVLAGALQDWCRAKIIGRRSFGKGLVQEQYDLSDGSAIRLTVARYFTPQGRSIQRPYDKGKKIYIDEILERYSEGEVLHPDSIKYSNGRKYKTVCGDTVYGGGGITPHIIVPFDTSSFPRSINRLLLDGGFNGFVYNYYLAHRQEVDSYKDPAEFSTSFNRMEDMWNAFISIAAENGIRSGEISPPVKQNLQKRMKASLARYRWRTQGFYQVINQDDPMIRKAMEN